MKPKLRLFSTGAATFIELDGKTLGPGVKRIELTHDGGGKANLTLSINVEDFSFMPAGYIDTAAKRLEEANPPDDGLVRRENNNNHMITEEEFCGMPYCFMGQWQQDVPLPHQSAVEEGTPNAGCQRES